MMDCKIAITRVEFDEETTREQLVREVVYQVMLNQKLSAKLDCKDELIESLRGHIKTLEGMLKRRKK